MPNDLNSMTIIFDLSIMDAFSRRKENIFSHFKYKSMDYSICSSNQTSTHAQSFSTYQYH